MRSTEVRAYGNTPAELEADAMAQAAAIMAGLNYQVYPSYRIYDLTHEYVTRAAEAEGTRRGKQLYARIAIHETKPVTAGTRAYVPVPGVSDSNFRCGRCEMFVPLTHYHSCGKGYSTTYPKGGE